MWSFFHNASNIYGPKVELPACLSWDAVWLDNHKQLIARHWLAIHCAFRKKRPEFGVFQLASWFSALAFTTDYDTRSMIEVLFAIASIPDVASVAPPAKTDQYNLSMGYSFVKHLITSDVESGGYGYRNSAEAKLSILPHEEEWDASTRRHTTYERNFNFKVKAFISYLESQWPCERPKKPTESDCAGLRAYVDVDETMTAVRSRWKIWYQNHLFYEYLTKLAEAISRQSIDSSTGQLPPLPKLPAYKLVASNKGFAATADLFAQNQPPIIRPEDRPQLCLNLGRACDDSDK